jgi:DDE superfamily endonuclease
LTPTCEGTHHDKKIADETGLVLPEGSSLAQDTGFQGFALANVTIIQHIKKPRGKELTPEQKESNRRISSLRIRIEHAIGGVKRYRIVKDQCRARKNNFRDQVMETCCGLHNFRLNFRPWHCHSDSLKT